MLLSHLIYKLSVPNSGNWNKNNPAKIIHLETYQKNGGASSLLKNHVKKIIGNFTSTQKAVASQAFDHLVTRRGTKMAHTVAGLAKKLFEENTETLRQVLERLSDQEARILRSQKGQSGERWYELYHDMFSDSIEEWNTEYKDEQRKKWIRKRAFQWGGGVIFIIGLSYAAYDGGVNYTSHHLRLSVKSGVSDAIEVYLGKFGSTDIFRQQKYLGETGYQRAQVEPDKLFDKKPVGDFDALNVDLIGHLPLVDRITAYLESGEINKALKLAKKSISSADRQRSVKVINKLAEFRSIKSIELFKEFIETSQDSYLKEKIIVALGTINRVQSVDALIIALNDRDEKLRESSVKALGELGDSKVVEV
jgi:hypothetical protein